MWAELPVVCKQFHRIQKTRNFHDHINSDWLHQWKLFVPTERTRSVSGERVGLSVQQFFVVQLGACTAGRIVRQSDVERTRRRDDHVASRRTQPGRPPGLRHEGEPAAGVLRNVTYPDDERKPVLTECSEHHARLLAGLTHWSQVTGKLDVLWLAIQHLCTDGKLSANQFIDQRVYFNQSINQSTRYFFYLTTLSLHWYFFSISSCSHAS